MRRKRSERPERAELTTSDLPAATADELMRMLIDPMHALALVAEGKVGEALANATRRIIDLRRDGLGKLVRDDILIALAELELRAKQLPPTACTSLRTTQEALETAQAVLEEAQRSHTRAKAEILLALGYREKAEALGFRVGIVEA